MNQDGDGGSDNGGRDIFATNSDIFENRDLLKVGYVPGLDQIAVNCWPRRANTECRPIDRICYCWRLSRHTTNLWEDRMRQVSRGSCSYSREAKQRAAENGYNFEYSYIDCSEYRTETKASRQIAREIKRSIGDPDLNIPGQGYRLRIIGIWFGR